MSDAHQVPASLPRDGITVDRRKPAARYLEFHDLHVLQRVATAADRAYKALVGSDDWAGGVTTMAFSHAAPDSVPKRRLLRTQRPATVPTVVTTPALAKVANLCATAPAELEASPNACTASRSVAHILATVARELVGELVHLTPEQQAAHPAYRQTLRLGAELEALREVVLSDGCTPPDPCVVIRAPGHLDRRVEDAEVAEVSAVLLQLAGAVEAEQPHP